MGCLMHSRECGEATAVSVTSFHPDLVAEISKCGSRRLNLPVLVLQLSIFYCAVVEGTRAGSHASPHGVVYVMNVVSWVIPYGPHRGTHETP